MTNSFYYELFSFSRTSLYFLMFLSFFCLFVNHKVPAQFWSLTRPRSTHKCGGKRSEMFRHLQQVLVEFTTKFCTHKRKMIFDVMMSSNQKPEVIFGGIWNKRNFQNFVTQYERTKKLEISQSTNKMMANKIVILWCHQTIRLEVTYKNNVKSIMLLIPTCKFWFFKKFCKSIV